MHSVLNLISEFLLYSIVMSAVSETVAGLLISINKTFFITPEEERLLKYKKK